MKPVSIVLVACCFLTSGALAQTTTPNAGDALTSFIKCVVDAAGD